MELDIASRKGKIIHIMMKHVLILFENGKRYWIKIENLGKDVQIIPHIEQVFPIKPNKKNPTENPYKEFIHIFCPRCGFTSLRFYSNGKKKCMNPVCSIEIKSNI